MGGDGDDSNDGPGSPSILDMPNGDGGGKKRRRRWDPRADEGGPRVRVKKEPGLLDQEPPTPPMPRVNQEDEAGPSGSSGGGGGASVKNEVVDEEDPGSPMPDISIADVIDYSLLINEENGESAEPQPGPSSAMGVQSKARSDNDTGAPPNGSANEGDPSISNFFNFTSAPQPKVQLPNAMNADIKPKPVAMPERAHYLNYAPEDELKYGQENGSKSKRIPMFSKDNGTSDESEGEDDVKRDKMIQDSTRFSRYYQCKNVFAKYDFKNRTVDPTKLAVHDKKWHILNSLEKARVVIIEGFTGCGKTTQVPQYILDKCCEQQSACNIVVTQPRKIAALSVARRVCFERNWKVGTIVGYQVGMESKKDEKDTVLTFMTTGVLLQKLISSKSMKEFTHIIIDEVHERDEDTDFLLLVIKKIMEADREGKERHVRLVLMSATIDTKKFEDYFVFEKDDKEILPHVVKIPFIAKHRLEELYLDDLLQTKRDQLAVIDSNMDREKADIKDEVYDVCVSCIISLDDLERDAEPDPRMRRRMPKKRGAVLVFLPGMEEIKRLERALERVRKSEIKKGWAIFLLHSSVSAEDQQQVFQPPGDGFRKIILSTNIAESSITVSDITYVIDFCLTKSQCIDKATNFTTLRMNWAAKSQCIQRKGRAGRVSNGKVYRLVTKKFYQGLAKEIEPEMRRSNLDKVILGCKKLNFGSPKRLLCDALDRPRISSIERAISSLKELGALTIEMVDKKRNTIRYDEGDGDVTFLGRVMTDLPIPPQCTRLILLGHCFGVMHEAIIIAAGLSVKTPFQGGFHRELDTYLEKMKHAKKSFSDLFALYYVYKFWIQRYSQGENNRGNGKDQGAYRWAKQARVHLAVLKEIKQMVDLLEERLKRMGITDSYTLAVDKNADNLELSPEQGLFLKLAIAGAFYPHYFLRRRPYSSQYNRDIEKELNGHDCFRTVYFKGFPLGNKGQLYAKHVADYLTCGQSIPSVRFEGQKVLAIYDNSIGGDTIGPFNTAIFRAIKLRQLRTENLEFRVLKWEDEQPEINKWNNNVQKRLIIKCPPLRDLPSIDKGRVRVRVHNIISPAQFWVVVESDFHKHESLEWFIQNNLSILPFPITKLHPGALCLAPFKGKYLRAKIIRSDHTQTLVYYIDYGISQWVASSTLYDFSETLKNQDVTREPCMAIECRLKEMKPNMVYGLEWSRESIDEMNNFWRNFKDNLELDIYSIHNSIMAGELFTRYDNQPNHRSLNQRLLLQGFVSFAPESMFSQRNHEMRRRASEMSFQEKTAAGSEQMGDPLDLNIMNPPSNGITPVKLKGPWSPLEMTFQACVKCSVTKDVQFDNSSVNSVSLDHEPTDSNSRMLVAAHVSVVNKSRACMIRESTVMPAIPGILSLVSMIFAPKIELRVDKNQRKYTGMVCGCGTVFTRNRTLSPVHPDNDMEIVFDTEIDDEDIDKINFIRWNLNHLLRNGKGVNKSTHHKNLREELIKLLQKTRKQRDEEVWAQEEYVWDRIHQRNINSSLAPGLTFNHDDIFQPHKKVLLNASVEEEVKWTGGY